MVWEFIKMMLQNISSETFTEEALLNTSANLYEFIGKVKPHGPNWMNQQPIQWPNDLIMYQEILVTTVPTIVVELGVASGITCHFLNDMFMLMKWKGMISNWKIIGVDIRDSHIPFPETIKFILGSSLEVFNEVKSYISENDKVMVMLDSDHNCDYVLKEMELYRQLVTMGCYMVVEDGFNDIYLNHNAGPLTAIEKYLSRYDDFEVDYNLQRWVATQNYKGFLRKTK